MRIGIDLGGTKIEAVALESNGSELGRVRVDTPVGDYSGTVAALVGIVDRVEAQWGRAAGVGLGTPGAIDPTSRLVKNANSTVLNGKPLGADLTEALGREVRIANDADCLALSEAKDGAAGGADPVFAAILGTGVGGGLMANGALVQGPNAVAGEWGHNPLPWPGKGERPGEECYCGRTGCIETFLSGPAIARDYAARTGRSLAGREVGGAAESDDPAAVAVLETFVDRLARALASVINVIDPQVVVLGGGVSLIRRLYTDVPKAWARYVFSDRVLTDLVPAHHGDASGARGAARLWPE